MRFQDKYNKTYQDEREESKREKIFSRRMSFVNAHNVLYDEGKVGFKLALYEYADLSREEFLEHRTGLKLFQ